MVAAKAGVNPRLGSTLIPANHAAKMPKLIGAGFCPTGILCHRLGEIKRSNK